MYLSIFNFVKTVDLGPRILLRMINRIKKAFYQKIVYVEKASALRISCLRAIPSEVFKRLGRLTLKDNSKIAMSTIDNLYPDHVDAQKTSKRNQNFYCLENSLNYLK